MTAGQPGSGSGTSVTQRLVALIETGDPPLDEAMFLIAAHAHPTLDVAEAIAALDSLAEGCHEPTFDGLCAYCFGTLGLAGNSSDYSDPRNSYLDDVIERRLGIPITLAVVMMEIGRRVGVDVDGIGMPGHFLVRSRDDTSTYCDPFAGGAKLEAADCRELFRRIAGDDAKFYDGFLAPVSRLAIVARVLANLQNSTLARQRRDAVWVARIRSRIPGLTISERREIARLMGTLGSHIEAAQLLDDLACDASGAVTEIVVGEAKALRARAN